ncbi:GHKL domain-containing protein, partial [bacterium]|nr:GHKL domain-containing protein [bacterium]
VLDREFIEPVPLVLQKENRKNAIFLVMSSQKSGGKSRLRGPVIEIGDLKVANHKHLVNLTLTSVILMYFVVISIFHFYLEMRRPKDLDNIYFGFFVAIFAVFLSVNTNVKELIYGDSYLLVFKVAQVSLRLIPVFLVLFVSYFFLKKHSKFAVLIAVYSTLLAFSEIFIPLHAPSYNLRMYVWYVGLINAVVYSMYILITALKNGNKDAMYLILGIFLIAAGAIHDILVVSEIILPPLLIQYAVLVFTMGVSLISGNRFISVSNQLEELNAKLELKVDDRTRELRETQKELIEKAHKAGMAEIASEILHNVGNLLNNIKTSTQSIFNVLNNPNVYNLNKANEMLRQNMKCLPQFIEKDPNGQKLMQYYLNLEDGFILENRKIQDDVDRIRKKLLVIEDVISAQQSYTKMGLWMEKASLPDILEDVLTMQSESLTSFGVLVEKNYCEMPDLSVQKSKLIHVLINLINNAKDAMVEAKTKNKIIALKTTCDEDFVTLEISDSGIGIPEENLKKIFTHGFTTKVEGHGFGLHSSANYLAEMKGKMWATSPGVGKGSTMILQFPVNKNA